MGTLKRIQMSDAYCRECAKQLIPSGLTKFCDVICEERHNRNLLVNLRSAARKKKKAARLNAKEKKRSLRKKKTRRLIPKESFYDSDRWRAMRYRVLKTYGRLCMACGTTNGEMHVDHIKPRSKYRTLELEFTNLQVLCKDCNFGKSNMDDTDFRPVY